MHELFVEKTWIEKLRGLFFLLLAVAVVVLLVFWLRGSGQLVVRDVSAYQAVFLDNGQVYFGKLKSLNRDFVSLTDIYYLRAGTVQQGEAGQPASAIDLIKLGAELHAPRDEMIIGKEHIIFYEDIGKQSEVMKLIEQHKSGQ